MIVVAFCFSLIGSLSKKLKLVNFAVIQLYYGIVATLTNGIIMVIRSVQGGILPFNGTTTSTCCMILLAGLLNVVGFNLMTIAN